MNDLGNRLWLGTVLAVLGTLGCTGEIPADTSLQASFVQPTDAQLLLADADQSGADSTYQTTVVVKASDTAGRTVELDTAQLEGIPTAGFAGGVLSVSGDTVTFTGVTLPPGVNQLRATVQEKGSLRKAEATVSFTVQTPRPRVSAVTVDGDANHDLRLNAVELPSGPPVMHITTFGVEDGQPVVVRDSGNAVVAQTTASGNTATVTLTSLGSATESDFPLSIELTNALGLTNNLGSAQPGYPTNTQAKVTLRIDRVAPVLVVTAPSSGATLGLAADADPAPGFQLHVTGTTAADVGAGGIHLTLTPPGGAAVLADAAAGAFATNLSGAVEGAATLTVSATDTSGNPGPAVVLPLTFDLTGPLISNFFCNGAAISGTVTPVNGALTIVAASNVHFYGQPYPTLQPGYLADSTPGGNADVQCGYTITGAVGGTVRVLYNGVQQVAPITLGSSPDTLSQALVLPQNSSASLVVEARDTAQNLTSLSIQTTIDVQPPANPNGVATRVVSASRQVQVDLTWSGSGDDGLAGTAAGFDVRYRPEGLFDEVVGVGPPLQLTRIVDDFTYFHPLRSLALSAGALLPASQLAASLTGLPPWSEFSVVVRAVDEVGNCSPFASDQHVLLQNDATTGFTIVANPEAAGPSGSSRFGWNMAAGDFNGDGKTDLVVGEPFDKDSTSATPNNLASKVHVISGQANLSAAFPAPLQIVSPEGTIQRFGRDISVGNVDDVASGSDLLVSAYLFSSLAGRALLYFGQASPLLDATLSPTTPHVVDFRGNANSWFGYTARIVGDFGSVGGGASDGLSEVAIAAPNAVAGGKGRVYLFWGRSKANWLGFVGGSIDATAGTYTIPADAADVIFEGIDTCGVAPLVSCPTFFGANHGLLNVGDVNGDGVADLAIPHSNDLVNKLYVFSGAAIRLASGTATVLTPASAIATLTQSAVASGAASPSGTLNGFGSEAVLAPSLLGANAALVVTLPLVSRAFIYPSAVQSSTTPVQTLEPFYGRGRFLGWSLATGDLNGDGKADLVLGENVSTPGASAWMVFNSGNTSQPFDALVGQGAHQSRATGLRSLGASVVVGDFNGDARLDVAAGDPGNNGDLGEVRIFY